MIALIGGKRAEKLKEHSHRTMRPWLISVALATLILGHIAFLRFTLSPAVPAVAIMSSLSWWQSSISD